jgi:hypothetical protein
VNDSAFAGVAVASSVAAGALGLAQAAERATAPASLTRLLVNVVLPFSIA